MNRIDNITVSILKADLIQPFRTALGSHDCLENLLVKLELSDGTKGCGEAAVATHITGETIQGTKNNLKKAAEKLIGRDGSDYLKISAELNERLPHNKCAVAAIECALMDALTRQWKIPLWKLFGARPVKLVSDITIVIADLAETEKAVSRFYRRGFRTFKVKIGRDFDLDIKRVASVKRLTRGSKIILDANQGYSGDQTLKFIKELKKIKVRPALIEQPVPKKDWEGLKRVARSCGIPVCADESVGDFKEALRAVKEKAVPVINIKLMKSGLIEAHKIALLAKANGIKLMIGGMMESSLAMTASAHLASGLGCFDFIDLDTPFFIKDGLKRNSYLNSKGVYDLKKVKAGIGISIKNVKCEFGINKVG